jgi:DNA-directed RNA polymerase subunit RPC12/RpoP
MGQTNCKIIKIGRHPENDFFIEKKDVSRWHAYLTLSGNSIVLQEYDSNHDEVRKPSTYGTFLNNIRVDKPMACKPEDTVRFATSIFKIKDILESSGVELLSYVDFFSEFNNLKEVYETYKKNLRKLENESQLRKRIILIGAIIIVSILMYFGLMEYNFQYFIMIPIIAVAAFLNFFEGNRIKQRKELFDEAFKDNYKCPKCKRFLQNEKWERLEEQGKCPYCGVQWRVN